MIADIKRIRSFFTLFLLKSKSVENNDWESRLTEGKKRSEAVKIVDGEQKGKTAEGMRFNSFNFSRLKVWNLINPRSPDC